MSGDIEEQHIIAFLSGDPNALDDDALTEFTDFAIKIIRHSYRRKKVRDADLEDLAHIAIEAAWEARRGYRGEAKFTTWLSRIILRTVYKHYEASHVDRDLTTSLDSDEDGWREFPIAASTNIAEIVRIRLLWEYGKSVLSERQLQAFQMQRQGFSEQEIGEALGAGHNASSIAKQLIKNAREKLKYIFSIAADGEASAQNEIITDDQYE